MADYYIAPKGSFDATADIIREKLNSQETIEWNQNGFADVVERLGDYSIDDMAARNTKPNVVLNGNVMKKSAFRDCTTLVSFKADNIITLSSSNAADMFNGCINLESLDMPNLTSVANSSNFCRGCSKLTTVNLPSIVDLGDYSFQNCTSLKKIAFPSANGSYRTFMGCSSLEEVDYGAPSPTNRVPIERDNFSGCTKLSVVILRNLQVTALGNISAFTNTPFASGGAGGTIYIPKSLYDHLSDGTALDYKVATNWSTVDAYGTITWAQIEGSIYETYYADGTPIT